MWMQYAGTTIEHKCHRDVDRIGLLDMRNQMRKKGIFSTRDQSPTMRSLVCLLNVTPSAANVVSLLRDDMTNATSWISHVTNAPRDNMDMKVGNSLAGGSALIEAHVESVDGVAIAQEALCLGNGFANIRKLFAPQVVPNGRMSLRNNEKVPLCDRIPIPNCDRMFSPKGNPAFIRITEGTAISD